MIKAFEFIGWFLLGIILFIGINITIDSTNPCSQFYRGGEGACTQTGE